MDRIKIAVSSRSDGTMKSSADEKGVRKSRQLFLDRSGFDADQACIVRLHYDRDDYCRYNEVDTRHSGEGVVRDSTLIADALMTRQVGQTLFLPLADCVGAVIWDKDHTALMVSHLGRHNLEQYGGRRSIEYFTSQTGIQSADLRVYLSPGAGKESYPLFAMQSKGLHEAAVEQLLSAGVRREAIAVDERDTTSDQSLFSHSEFLKGRRTDDGRFAVFAMLKK